MQMDLCLDQELRMGNYAIIFLADVKYLIDCDSKSLFVEGRVLEMSDPGRCF